MTETRRKTTTPRLPTRLEWKMKKKNPKMTKRTIARAVAGRVMRADAHKKLKGPVSSLVAKRLFRFLCAYRTVR
jgi:hypothetical protein